MSFYLFEMKAKVEHECIVKRLKYKIYSVIYTYLLRDAYYLWKVYKKYLYKK